MNFMRQHWFDIGMVLAFAISIALFFLYLPTTMSPTSEQKRASLITVQPPNTLLLPTPLRVNKIARILAAGCAQSSFRSMARHG